MDGPFAPRGGREQQGVGDVRLDRALGADPRSVGDDAEAVERLGYGGLWVSEVDHDPFVLAAIAASRTQRVEIGTGIAVAFARNPVTMAYLANDLQSVSNGRFFLGLGSQVRAHIERRFSMPWSRPAARMREFVLAMQSVFRSWELREPLAFAGEFFTHTLMPSYFSPPANEHGPPPLLVAGVGEAMTRVAAEVADGFLFHAFTTRRYLRERTLPALAAGRQRAGKDLAGFTIAGPVLVVAASNDSDLDTGVAACRSQLAFYASTPAYRNVLEVHGWAQLQDELIALARAGRWEDMPDLIDEDVLHTFAIIGDAAHVADEVARRYGDLATRVSLYTPYAPVPDDIAQVAARWGLSEDAGPTADA